MSIGVHPGTPEAEAYLQHFREVATEEIQQGMTEEGQEGALLRIAFGDHLDGVRATATFTMNSHPGMVFTRTRNILPVDGTQWDATFAAGLFTVTLFEKFHTWAKRQEPVNGTIAY